MRRLFPVLMRKLPVFLILFVLLTSCESTRVAERVEVLAERQAYHFWFHQYSICVNTGGDKCRTALNLRDLFYEHYDAMRKAYEEKWGVEP